MWRVLVPTEHSGALSAELRAWCVVGCSAFCCWPCCPSWTRGDRRECSWPLDPCLAQRHRPPGQGGLSLPPVRLPTAQCPREALHGACWKSFLQTGCACERILHTLPHRDLFLIRPVMGARMPWWCLAVLGLPGALQAWSRHRGVGRPLGSSHHASAALRSSQTPALVAG